MGQSVWYGDEGEREEAEIVSIRRKRISIRLNGVNMAVRPYRLEPMGGCEVVGQESLLGDEFAPPPKGEDPRNVQTVFEAWQVASGRKKTALDTKRRAKICAALKLFPLEDVLDAVRGWLNDPFYCGENDRKATYNEITLLLRDAEHVERFRDMWRAGPKTVRPTKAAARQNAHEVRRAFALGEAS